MELTVTDSSGGFIGLMRPDELLTGFTECAGYRIACAAGFSGVLLVDEISLSYEPENSCWLWSPGLFAGEVCAELRDEEQRTVARYRLDVSPDPTKLGRYMFDAMVERIAAINPLLLLGTEPASIAIGTEGDLVAPNLQYLRLRLYGEAYIASLQEIARKPIRRLRQRRQLGRIGDARRVDIQTVRATRNSASSALALAGVHDDPERARFDLPYTDETFDNGANRAMRYFLDAVVARLRRLREQLAREERKNETRTELSERWPERRRVLASLERALRTVSRRTPFSEISRRELTSAGLNAVSGHPAYARAQRLAWSILRSGAAGYDASETHQLTTSWEVFERWCFIEVAEVAAKVLGKDFDPAHLRFRNGDKAAYRASNGQETFEIQLQETFSAYRDGTHDKLSVSRLRVPDITLRYWKGGKLHRWIVLDAKYRVSRSNVLDAMASAHIYHDALRVEGRRPDLSLLLVPARPEASWLADEAFIAEHRVGVVDMSHKVSLQKLLLGFANEASQ